MHHDDGEGTESRKAQSLREIQGAMALSPEAHQALQRSGYTMRDGRPTIPDPLELALTEEEWEDLGE